MHQLYVYSNPPQPSHSGDKPRTAPLTATSPESMCQQPPAVQTVCFTSQLANFSAGGPQETWLHPTGLDLALLWEGPETNSEQLIKNISVSFKE